MAEWLTPKPLVDAVRSVLGDIDLDPASCAEANVTVQARCYFTPAEDGLTQPWPGRVWLFPPFGRTGGKSHQELWTARLVDQFERGITQEAILMVPACTAAKWFQPLYDYTICFTLGRIRCISPSGQASHPTKGSAIVYLGPHKRAFREAFDPAWGTVVKVLRPDS